MRAVIYARVSSRQQKERHTIGSQLRACPAFVQAQGWELVRPVSTYVDDGISAKTGSVETRDGLRRLLADAEAGAFDVVVAVEDDRLTRADDLLERLEIFGRFKRAGVRLAFVATGQIVDPRASTDELLAIIKGWVAADERRKITERTQRGVERAILDGRKPRGATCTDCVPRAMRSSPPRPPCLPIIRR
jgi:DNA invertase Pin-like site-specific DNA recombinase